MGLFDKIKDLFVDEEDTYETKEIEVEEKEEKNELPTFMRNKIEKEEEENKIKEEKKKEEEKQIAVLVEPPKKEEKKFSFEFDDDDFVDTSRLSRSTVQKEKKVESIKEAPVVPIQNTQSVVKPYGNKKELDKPKKFRPTPVISPVYGVLDKNYTKEEVVSKEEDSYAIQRPSKKVDFESVRKKAFGDLTDDIRDSICENCEYLKEVKINKKIERLSEEDLLYNLTTDEKENLKEEIDNDVKEEVKDEIVNNIEEELPDKDITLGEAVENYVDYGVSYDIPPRRTKETKDEVKIVNHADNEVVGEKVEVIEPIDEVLTEEKKETNDRKKDLELTDDLFNLIDSMYKERDD